MTLTFIDSGVLIAAARCKDDLSEIAMKILDDPDRTFASSDLVRLEVLPKAVYHRQTDEAAFYEAFFDEVAEWAEADQELVQAAYEQAQQYGVSAMDALHVAAALSVGAKELVTAEKRAKPIHRVESPRITSIRPE